MIKLVAIDLDDTLLNKNIEISPENLAAIARIRAAGVTVCIATGRMYHSALPYAKQLQLPADQILICYNGAMVRRVNGELIEHIALEHKTALDVVEYCQKHNWTTNLYYNDQLYVREIDENVEYYQKMVSVKANPVGDLHDFVEKEQPELSKILIIGSDQEVDENLPVFQKQFGAQAQVTRSKRRYIEITNLGATKGKALARLANNFKLDANQVMAIGDGGNDVEMIKWAGIGVAVENGNPLAKEAAEYITATNDQNGVARAIDRFI